MKDEDRYCREVAESKYEVERAKFPSLASKDPSPDLPRPGKRIAGHVWAVFSDALVLLVVLFLLSKVHTTFEQLAIALLVYLHLEISGAHSHFSRLYQAAMVAMGEDIRRLRSLAGEKVSDDDRVEQAIESQRMKQDLRTADVRYFIHGAFQVLMWLAVVYSLLTALIR